MYEKGLLMRTRCVFHSLVIALITLSGLSTANATSSAAIDEDAYVAAIIEALALKPGARVAHIYAKSPDLQEHIAERIGRIGEVCGYELSLLADPGLPKKLRVKPHAVPYLGSDVSAVFDAIIVEDIAWEGIVVDVMDWADRVLRPGGRIVLAGSRTPSGLVVPIGSERPTVLSPSKLMDIHLKKRDYELTDIHNSVHTQLKKEMWILAAQKSNDYVTWRFKLNQSSTGRRLFEMPKPNSRAKKVSF